MTEKEHICFSEDMHPYNCDGLGFCIHCDKGENEKHNPKDCILCTGYEKKSPRYGNY